MTYKTIYIQTSFNAGRELGSLNSFLTSNEAGYARLVAIVDSVAEVEIAAASSIIMSYCEDRLSAYV